jgi:ADP-heptose:LPS heptosyltransferase
VVVERLADLFEPRLCDIYASMFSEVIARSIPDVRAADLVARYERVRRPRILPSDPKAVYILSRVTLGADVAITSVLLDAAKRRFPRARIFLAGGRKSWELFAGDPRVEHAPVAYLRSGNLEDRLKPWRELRRLFGDPDLVVIDPDSRLTQLGLVPVCAEEKYSFFESRAYGADGDDPLPVLSARWARETLGVSDAVPWIAPAHTLAVPGHPLVTMSLGVGENPAKRLTDDFEQRLVRLAAQTGAYVLIDEGAGGEEAERVARAIASCGAPAGKVRSFRGGFAEFASAIAQSDLYIGYDSAGQHVAAARGVPLLSVFAGFPSPRFFSRWRPWGRGRMEVVPAEGPVSALELCSKALEGLAGW